MTVIARRKCPDCLQCRECAPPRCLQCRKSVHRDPGELGCAFTHGRYLEWKRGRAEMDSEKTKSRPAKVRMRRPTVDLARCRDCDACLEVCPGVFGRNEDTGRLEVADLAVYAEEEVAEAMSLCPENCICWEEGPP